MKAVAFLTIASVAASADGSLRAGQKGADGTVVETDSFVRNLDFKQKLRVCNAYPYSVGLDVFIGKDKLSASPVAYKSCEEYNPKLKIGDKIDFKVDDSSAGTFSIGELPQNDAVLMMVIHRRDTLSNAVAFESHVFSNVEGTQVAVLDTFKGKATSELRIQDVATPSKNVTRSELLRYENVVVVNPGIYELQLQALSGTALPSGHAELVAVSKESYVVIRCGVAAQEGESYPEEIFVYPQSDKKAFGGAGRAGVPCVLAALLAMLAIF